MDYLIFIIHISALLAFGFYFLIFWAGFCAIN